jgi:BirA family transcriptional regulator, biotin operon repressor / biotin---[acetyl-CoA-carboxylase] ligase
MQLDPIVADAGVQLLALAAIGSTNHEARVQARRGARGPLWITATAQTAGRGRMDRTWVSPEGNLYASLLLSEPSPFEHARELSFVAALALRDAIIAEAPSLAPRLGFKWPNDLLLADEKCAGILIEGEVEPGKSLSVVIGIGVNCAKHPPTAPSAEADLGTFRSVPMRDEAVLFPATDLCAHGADITPQQLFQRLSATMCLRLAQWDRGRGFSIILGDWLSAARGIGKAIRVRNGGSEKTGRFAGLDQSGRLVLETAGGNLEKISAGDVFPFELLGGRLVPSQQA